MDLLTTPDALTAWADAHRDAGRRVGLVPTMGFLHDGHASLMDLARPRCDALVISIFVNPLQFGAAEDLDTYPRDLKGDLGVCGAHGVDAVFAPSTMYPSDFATTVHVEGLTGGLCGASRPTHFDGVTTVVARLFGLSRCAVAAFGEKDWQQLMVVRRMVRDLAMPVTLIPGPIVREPDGLAMSSRNVRLTGDQRRRGLTLSRALTTIRDAVDGGETSVERLLTRGREALDADRVDYFQIVDAERLTPLTVVDRPARALVAAFYGSTRLIDNLAVGPDLPWT